MSRIWVWVALLAIPVAFLGWIAHGIIAFATADNRIPEGVSVPCSEAMRFVDKDGLPTGAHDATCTARTWLDTQYDVAFHISRADLDRWLASDYPGTKLESGYCHHPDTVDACAPIELDPSAQSGAMAIDVSVKYEESHVALVHFAPFDV